MIRFLKHSEIDPEKWNQAVRNSLSSNVLAEYELLNLLTDGDTWHALVENDYEAVMPLPTRKKGVLKYVYTPFFLPQMGIISEREITSEETDAFLKEISKHYVLTDVLLNEKNGIRKQNDTNFVSHYLSLQPDYNELYSLFHENTKRNIKVGKKMECRVTVGEESVADIIALFRENRGQAEAVHYHDHDYKVLEKVANHLLEKGLLDIYGVRTTDNKLAAGALFVKDGNLRWFWFSGRDNQLSACKPMFLLLDAFIHDHAGLDLLLDFNGSKNENVARLYQGFGGNRYIIPFVRRFRNRFWKMVLAPFVDGIG